MHARRGIDELMRGVRASKCAEHLVCGATVYILSNPISHYGATHTTSLLLSLHSCVTLHIAHDIRRTHRFSHTQRTYLISSALLLFSALSSAFLSPSAIAARHSLNATLLVSCLSHFALGALLSVFLTESAPPSSPRAFPSSPRLARSTSGQRVRLREKARVSVAVAYFSFALFAHREGTALFAALAAAAPLLVVAGWPYPFVAPSKAAVWRRDAACAAAVCGVWLSAAVAHRVYTDVEGAAVTKAVATREVFALILGDLVFVGAVAKLGMFNIVLAWMEGFVDSPAVYVALIACALLVHYWLTVLLALAAAALLATAIVAADMAKRSFEREL